jgi:hypothetical protein
MPGLHRSPGGRDRRDVSEQLGLPSEGVEVTEAVGSIDNGDSEMSQDHARIVGVPRDAAVGHRLRQRACQPSAIGELAQHRGARVRDEIATVGGYLDATNRATTMHLPGGLLLGRLTALEHSHPPS